MLCPSCQNTLRERERNSVLLDICPGCGGVWLDRGELEKLTASERSFYRGEGDAERGRTQRYEAREDRCEPRYNGPQRYDAQKRKQGGFLENIFGSLGEGGADD